jgi:hypothetical protein
LEGDLIARELQKTPWSAKQLEINIFLWLFGALLALFLAYFGD